MITTVFISASDTPISDAALYALVGFVIVLVVLALLVGIFYLTGFLFQTKVLSRDKLFERKPKKKLTESVPAADDPEETDEELFAVISAVISSVYDSEAGESEEKPDFVIRRVKRNK